MRRNCIYLLVFLLMVGFAPLAFSQTDAAGVSEDKTTETTDVGDEEEDDDDDEYEEDTSDPKGDADGDGIPNGWEKKYGLNPLNPSDSELDPDFDKVNNLEEFKLGTVPNDKDIDKNKDGVADDWMKKFKLTDAKADPDGDGVSTKDEYDAGTNPTDKNSSPKKEVKVSQKRTQPSMAGVRANLDPNVGDDHRVKGKKNVFRFLDPIGDDKGPGYYTYPTNPVYSAGGFDILSFEVDASGKDNIIFKVTVNADLKQEWGMAADFDVQYIQIYIDQDRTPGSGAMKSIPGLNVYFDPSFAWEKAVVISPQPKSRVQIEVDLKAKEMAENIVVPNRVSGQGRTLIAVVSRKQLGIGTDEDISKWAWQVVAQSNEGYPDPEDVMTRNVNEYRGLHRFGGGDDYWGDPEVLDILVWPAKGTVEEAKDQFAMLNIWESYPDPTLDIRAVMPAVDSLAVAQWMPKGGYKANAKRLAELIKPPAKKDKYVSGNFDLYGKLFTRWGWNADPTKDNFFKNSLELGIDGKLFTELVDFYLRFELADWENTGWQTWANSTPGQEKLALQSRRVNLISPFPTVDLISIGNYELNYAGVALGQAWYPDRDKVMGLFIDGSIEGVLSYNLTVHYPLDWIGFEFGKGANRVYDLVYGYKVTSSVIPGVKLNNVTAYYTDYEINPLSSSPKTMLMRGDNFVSELDGDIKLPAGFMISFMGAYSWVGVNPEFIRLEKDSEVDIDGNKVSGAIGNDGMQWAMPYIYTNGLTNELRYGYKGLFGKLTLRNDNMFGSGFGFLLEGFVIDPNFNSFTAARGDTSDIGGSFGGVSGIADVLSMQGNQSIHRAPQAADFVGSIPLPQLPSEFVVPDPVTSTKGIGWVNENWEGVTALGWRGATAKFKYSSDIMKLQLEGSYVGHGSEYSNMTAVMYTTNHEQMKTFAGEWYQFKIHANNLSRLRAYFVGTFSFFGVFEGMELIPACVFEKIGTLNDVAGEGALGADARYGYSTVALSPMLSASVQWTKTLNTIFTYRFDFASINQSLGYDGIDGRDNIVRNFSRHRLILQANYSLPIGFYKVRGEYWYEGENADFAGRTPFGGYFVAEWEYGF